MMTRSRYRTLALLGIALMAIFVLANRRGMAHGMPSALLKVKAAAARSRAKAPAPSPYPTSTYSVAGSYYNIDGYKTTLILNNKGKHQQHPQIYLYSVTGERLTISDITVEPRSFREIDLAERIRNAGASGFNQGSAKMAYSGIKLEMGAHIRMISVSQGLEFDEQLTYPLDGKSNRLELVYATVNASVDRRAIITNTSGAPSTVRVRSFRSFGSLLNDETFTLGPWQLRVVDISDQSAGDPVHGFTIDYSGQPGSVLARAMEWSNPGYSQVTAAVDPASLKSSAYHGTGVSLDKARGGYRLSLLARNVGSVSTMITGRLVAKKRDGSALFVPIPWVQLVPGQSTEVDATDAVRQVANESADPTAGIEIEYSTAPGSVIVVAANESQNRKQVLRIPLLDPVTIPSGTGGYYWQIGGGWNALVHLKNVTDQPQKYAYEVRTSSSAYGSSLRTLGPHQSVTIDVQQLRDDRVPDARGRTIPIDAESGQFSWSIRGGDPKGMLGRQVEINDSVGIDSTYACFDLGAHWFHYDYLDPWELYTYVGRTGWFTAWEVDQNVYEDDAEPYEISGSLDWYPNYDDTKIEGIGGGAFVATGEGVSAMEGYGESQAYDPSCANECQFSPSYAPIDLMGDVHVTQATPTSFVVDTTAPSGFTSNPALVAGNTDALPKIVVRYKWESTSGSLPDLNTNSCPMIIGEDISYVYDNGSPSHSFPNGIVFIRPELHDFPVQLGKNTIKAVLGKDGTFDDVHGTDTNTNELGAHTLVGTQTYKYSCDNGANWTTIPSGTAVGPHTITRTISGSDPYTFSITKTIGGSATGPSSCTISPLTGYCQ
jgi:hypothetical protein